MATIVMENLGAVKETSNFFKADADPAVSVGAIYLKKSAAKDAGVPQPRRIKKVTVEFE